MREPKILKRFYSDTFAPPSGFSASLRGPEVTAEEILAGGVRESDWSFPVLVSTPSEDRQGDIVIPDGCDYSAFARSPICFFDHQEIRFPVGSMCGPDGRLYLCIVPGKGILGRIWIRQPEPDDPPAYGEACKTVWILVRDGLLNGISAGFDPVPGHTKALRGGGNKYERWELLEVSAVPIAANRQCGVIREPFSWDEAILKRFSPSVIKGLRTMTAAAVVKEHDNTHDIKIRGNKWIILDDKTRKVLSTHDSRQQAVAAMRALQVHKSMSESSGVAGGYTVPEEQKATYTEIAKRMGDHDAEGHSLYFNHETGELHHSYPDSESEDKLTSIAADLHDLPGVKSMTQEPEAGPKGEGFHKVYPCKDMDTGDSEMVEDSHQGKVQKRARLYARLGERFYGIVQQQKLKSWGIQRHVRRIMPLLLKGGMAESKAIGVAWYDAAQKKGYGGLVAKGTADGDDDDDDTLDDADHAADDAVADAAIEATGVDEKRPPSLELIQTAIENLEAALPGLEPEDRQFVEEDIERWREWGESKHPGEDFGGEDDAGKEAAEEGDNETKEEKISDQMLARYKSYRPVRVKHISIAKIKKSLEHEPQVADAIRKAANHLHTIGDLHPEFHAKTGDCVGMKGYTAACHKACRRMARDLDRVHGAITKGQAPAQPEEQPPAPESERADASGEDFGPVVKSMREEFDNMKKTLAHVAGIRLGA